MPPQRYAPAGTAYFGIITPACNSDAGAATDLLDVAGVIRVTATPRPNTAISIIKKSGLSFTFFLYGSIGESRSYVH
jgi:hypothetical protein